LHECGRNTGSEGDEPVELAMELPVLLVLLIGVLYVAQGDSLFSIDWRGAPHYFTDPIYSARTVRACPQSYFSRKVSEPLDGG
jgi:hypothetical protein